MVRDMFLCMISLVGVACILSGCTRNVAVETIPLEDLCYIEVVEPTTEEVTTTEVEETTEEVSTEEADTYFNVEGTPVDISGVASENDIFALNYGEHYGTLEIPSCSISTDIVVGANQELVDTNDVCISTMGSFCGDDNPVLICGHKTNSLGKIYDIQVGSHIIVNTVYGNFVYEVTKTGYGNVNSDETNILDEDGNNMLVFDSSARILQVYTCHGEDGGTERFVVRANQIAGTFIER